MTSGCDAPGDNDTRDAENFIIKSRVAIDNVKEELDFPALYLIKISLNAFFHPIGSEWRM